MRTQSEAGGRRSRIVATRRLAARLAAARRAADLTQNAAARALHWSPRRHQLLEAGDQVMTDRDLDAILPTLGVAEEEWPVWRALVAEAHEPGWWDAWSDEDLPPGSKRFLGLEHGCRRLRAFEPLVVHGLLQTPAYRAAVATSTSVAQRPDEQVRAMVEVSRRRQEVLADPSDPLSLWAILDEAALHRTVGTAGVMAEQLAAMIHLAERHPHVTVQVIPFGAGMHAGLHGSFTLMELGGGDDSLVFVAAVPDRPAYLESRADVYAYSQVWGQISDLALPAGESVQMLRDLAGRPPGGD